MLEQKFSCCAWVPMLKLSVTPREGKKQAPSAQQNSDSESVQLKSPLGSGIGSYVGWALSFILRPALGVFTDHFGYKGKHWSLHNFQMANSSSAFDMRLLANTGPTHEKKRMPHPAGAPHMSSADEGLFKAHAQEYMAARDISVRWAPPPGCIPLSGGDSSNTFLSHDSTVVYKCYMNMGEAQREWKMVRLVMGLAPQYTAGPARFFLAHGGGPRWSYYVLSTRYAGEMLSKRMSDHRLTVDEFYLCLLQGIHFVLLLGTLVVVDDVFSINICVRKEGHAIQVRWIDFVTWQAPSMDTIHILGKNAKKIVGAKGWSSERYNAAHADVYRLMHKFTGTALVYNGEDPMETRAVIQSLMELTTRIVEECLEHQVRKRAKALQAKIRALVDA